MRVLALPVCPGLTSRWLTDELVEGEHVFTLHWTDYWPGVHERVITPAEAVALLLQEVTRRK